mgnify:CR=1 FL=1
MCGIAGFRDGHAAPGVEHWARTAAAMAAPLRHRGPDDAGVWADPAAGVGLAHRRLAVVEAEYRRSVGQLYPAYEQAALHRPRRSGP